MRLNEERIEAIALAITDRLAEGELVDLTIDEDDLASLIGEVMIADLKREDEIQREAVEWLEVNRKHVDPGSAVEAEYYEYCKRYGQDWLFKPVWSRAKDSGSTVLRRTIL